jgi:acyl-CoA thioester hydrolase
MRDKVIRFRHDMRNAENGEIAATCELTAVHLDRKVRKAVAFEPDICAAAEKLVL